MKKYMLNISVLTSLTILMSCGGEPGSDGAFLLIHGSEDPVINYQQAIDFDGLLKSNELRSSVHIIPNVAHSYMGETAQKIREASIQALKLCLEFMDDIFK